MKKLILLIAALSSFSFLPACVPPADPTHMQEAELAAENNIKLGLAYLQQGMTPRAKEKLLLALTEAPDWPSAQEAMGYFFEATGDKTSAEPYYQRAVVLSGQDGASLNNYGAFLCRDHRPLEAEKMFLQAAATKNYLNTAQAYENAGLCALTLPDKKGKNKAIFYFKKALAQEPGREISMRELQKLHE